jgi:hypothetical protein
MRLIPPWSLNRLIVLLLLGGLLMLMIDIRWEHRVELGRQWETWIPLVYIGLMLMVGILSLYRWERWSQKVLMVGFALGIVGGLLGIWFHGMADPVGNFVRVFAAWRIPLGTNGGIKVSNSGPPMIAPMAFIGIGLMGLLACYKQFRSD